MAALSVSTLSLEQASDAIQLMKSKQVDDFGSFRVTQGEDDQGRTVHIITAGQDDALMIS